MSLNNPNPADAAVVYSQVQLQPFFELVNCKITWKMPCCKSKIQLSTKWPLTFIIMQILIRFVCIITL